MGGTLLGLARMASPCLRKLGLSHFIHPVPMLQWEGDNPSEHLMAFLKGEEEETESYTKTPTGVVKLNKQLLPTVQDSVLHSCNKNWFTEDGSQSLHLYSLLMI